MTKYISPVTRRYGGYPEQWLYPATGQWTVGAGQIGTGTATQALTSTSAFTKNQGVLALVKPLTV